ncbi:MAG TPA: Gfo/Idh/MocA family oxidoreductase [Thermomicrobiales bacterium]|nr:Gfo/Idh/MocA family oxidoreductase [Thermomicrobiales bacterium]
MAETLGIGIVGLGRIGWFHAEQLRGGVAGARLVAAAVDPDHRRRLMVSGDAPCPLVEDVAALLALPEVEAVVIASPASLHEAHIALAAAAGKPIFAEKPLADSVAGARRAAESVRAAAVPFQIGFQRRFDPAYRRARELIEAGAIGAVEMFRGITCDVLPPVEFLRTSGGLFWDLAIHDFDAARFLTGDEIAAVHAVGAVVVEPRLAEFDDIDYGIVTLRFRGGALGVCQASWRAPSGYDIRAEVHGLLGKVVAEVDEKFPARLYDRRGLVSERHDRFTERFADAYRAELQAFVDAARAGRTPAPGLDDALRAVEISDAATRSRREGRWVEPGA